MSDSSADDAAHKERKREYQRQYYQANRDKIRARVRKYQAENADAIRERKREHREANKDQINERGRRYRQANRDVLLKRQRERGRQTTERKRKEKQQWREANRDLIYSQEQERRERRRERQRERSRRWLEANREKNKEQHRQWYLANRERVNAEAKQRYASDPLFRQETNRRNSDYAERNRDRIRAYQADRRARGEDRWYHMERTHGLDAAAWSAMWAAQEGRCYLCGNDLDLSPAKTHVEHFHGCSSGHDPKRSCRYCQRGLACSRCNTMIALAGDDPEFLRKIASVLETANRDIADRQLQAPQQLMLEL